VRLVRQVCTITVTGRYALLAKARSLRPGAVNKGTNHIRHAHTALACYLGQKFALLLGKVNSCTNKAGYLDRTAGAGLVIAFSLCHAGHSSTKKGLSATLFDIHKGSCYYSITKQRNGNVEQTPLLPSKKPKLVNPRPRLCHPVSCLVTSNRQTAGFSVSRKG
jgi:hypothetical protein